MQSELPLSVKFPQGGVRKDKAIIFLSAFGLSLR